MYDYDRRAAVLASDQEAYDYQRVMSSLSMDIVKQTVKMVSDVLTLAKTAVRSLKFNEKLDVHDELEKKQKSLVTLAKWMLSRRELEAEPVAQFAKLTSDLAELTEYWNRPLFLNKDRHAEKVEALYKRMQRVKDDVVKAFKQSGSWAATPAH